MKLRRASLRTERERERERERQGAGERQGERARELRLAVNPDPPVSASQSTGIIIVRHHARLKMCHFKVNNCQTWWYTLVIPVLGRLRQENRRFEDSLSNVLRLSAT